MTSEVAVSRDGQFVAAMVDVRTGTVHDLLTGSVVRLDIDEYDFGGKRVAVSSDGHFVASAAYHVKGVALHKTDGSLRWSRRDIKKTQILAWASDDRTLY